MDFMAEREYRDEFGANDDRIRETFAGDMDPDYWEHAVLEAEWLEECKANGTYVGFDDVDGRTVIAGEAWPWYSKAPDDVDVPF